jgi:molybdopterin-containing oxidoreductase family membrane subunit
MVGGKPVISYIPFFIVGFEFTILFAVFGNIIGMLLLSRLPNYKIPVQYDDRCSGEYFGLLATCSRSELDTLTEFFKTKGGETRIFE